jgi:hypothetical protein
MTTSKLNVSRASRSNTIWSMGYYFDEAPMVWWWIISLETKAFNCSGIFTVAYVDHTLYDVLSSGKPSDMVSTSLQPRMTRWRLSPSVGIASSFRSKLWSMQILSDLLISPSLLQSGESTSWAFYPGHREVSDSYFCHWHVHQVGRSYANSKYHLRRRDQIPAEYHIHVRRTQVSPHI